MRLIDLLRDDERSLLSAEIAKVEITGLTADSRRVQPGFLFAALAGTHTDGRRYVAEAAHRGAAAILAGSGAPERPDNKTGASAAVAFIVDENPRRRFAQMAARFHAGQPEIVAAVTGTNGKTSVVWFLRQIWATLGHSAGSIGTLGVVGPGFHQPGALTTPDPVTLHRMLASMARAGVDRLAIEASSHGLDQHRLDGIDIAAAAFTNLSRDHLDYHDNIEKYLSAKLRLFAELVVDGGACVLCADAPYASAVRACAIGRGLRVVSYGWRGEELRIVGLEATTNAQRLTVLLDGRRKSIELPLVGDFQAANALAAAGLAIATGASAERVLPTLARLEPVPGRLQQIPRNREGPAVYVDYAHTPDALAAALGALRPQTTGKLGVVFGCGGDRDAGKRPEMGRIAGALADRVIVTDDNPRSEAPEEIRREVLLGCPDAEEIGDRAEAIARGISSLNSGDVLLVAGKGHETGQIIGSQVLPFDDAQVARAVIEELER